MSPRSPNGLRTLWWIHVAFIGLYLLVAVTRLHTDRVGVAWEWAVWLDVAISLPALGVFFLLPRLARQRLGPGGMGLLRWSVGEVPALVGLVGFLSGGHVAWLTAHLGVSLVLLALSAPDPDGSVDP